MVRSSGPIVISDELRKTLFELRILSCSVENPELDLMHLANVERSLKITLPDDFLAVLASHIETIESDYEMSLSRIVKIAKTAWQKGCPQKWVAVGHVDYQVFICITKHTQEKDQTILHDYCLEDQSVQKFPLLTWLSEIRENLYDHLLDRDFNRQQRPRAIASPEETNYLAFIPRLVEPPAPARMRVVHPKFGEGEVLNIFDQGRATKLKIDFPLVGTKVTSARQVKFFDELF